MNPRSRALACAAAIATLAAPAAALAATKTYKGGIEGDQEASVTLKVKQGNDGRQVKSFVGKDFLISCEGDVDARLKSATITGLVDVNDRGKLNVQGSNGGQELKVAGKLTGKNNAKGTVRYSGRPMSTARSSTATAASSTGLRRAERKRARL